MESLGATAWYLFMVVPTGRGQDILDELISDEDYQEVLDWHYAMESEENDMLVRPTCAPHYYRIRFEHNRANEQKTKSRPYTMNDDYLGQEPFCHYVGKRTCSSKSST